MNKPSRSRGLHRAFAEIDLRQLATIKRIAEENKRYTKADIGELEHETITSLYSVRPKDSKEKYQQETFFSLFNE